MIAIATSKRQGRIGPRNDLFSRCCRQFVDQAEFAFRQVPAEAREELVQEAIAQAYDMFVRLCQRGKSSLAYATPLAQFAIRNVRAGRRHWLPVQFAGHHVALPLRGEGNHDRAARPV